MRDRAAIRRWLDGLTLLDELERDDLDVLAAAAEWVRVRPGDRLYAADDDGVALWLLVDGEIVVGDVSGDGGAGLAAPAAGGPHERSRVDGVVRRSITTPGYPLGWDGLVWPFRQRWDAVAATTARLLRVPRAVIDEHGQADDGFAARWATMVLWLAGAQLRGQHTRLVTRRYDDEVHAVVDVIATRADELRVTSPLHRIPGYLQWRPTVTDALRALETVRDGHDPVESEIARAALDILAGVRQELQIYLGLQRVYEAVASAPDHLDAAQLRSRVCRALVDLFDQTEHHIAGCDRLPDRPGSIVICNHLRSHPDNRLPNGFSLILDTHFVSAMVLYRTYGRAPIRVVRDSHRDETGHARYYDRLGYVMVPSSETTPLPAPARAARRDRFVAEAGAALRAGDDLVICPEGRTGPTAGSPRRMRIGAFMLAGAVDPEPPIVPVAVANFDQRLRRAIPGAIVTEPFYLSEVVADPRDRAQVAAFVDDDLTPRYRAWVEQAAALGS